MEDSESRTDAVAHGSSRTRDYQRVYKACELCRKKKIRCLFDGPGDPPGPPCARCKREQRQCVLSRDRSTRKSGLRQQPVSSVDAATARGNASLPSPSPAHNATTATVYDESPSLRSGYDTAQVAESVHYRQPTATVAQRQELADTLPADGTRAGRPHDPDPDIGNNGLTDTVMRTFVSTGNDALNVLFRAAEQRDQESAHGAMSTPRGSKSAEDYNASPTAYPMPPPQSYNPQIEPDILQLWESFRFVKMGWFTPREAVFYMDLFFKNLAAGSPACFGLDPTHAGHFRLITQEPLLCCTILMISSRFHTLPGFGGLSRGMLIHQRVWEHCQHLITRIMFGQEKKSKAKTRTPGSIQALFLIIEWHPKAIHFPPVADGWDSDLILSASDKRDDPHGNRAAPENGLRDQWLGDIIMPTQMSNRMSWMLFGCAMSLAHELGICDNANQLSMLDPQVQARNLRFRQLLYIFEEQLSRRLGCPSMAPSSLGLSVAEPLSTTASSPDFAFLGGWLELCHLSRTITDALFPSKPEIRQLLNSFRYVSIIKHFHQQLLAWKAQHLIEDRLTPNTYEELNIEYNHIRILMNSLGMQAAVDRWLSSHSGRSRLEDGTTVWTTTDYEFVQEVVSGASQLLQSANKLAERGVLRYSPVRILLRVIEASVFLLKALSFGTQLSELQAALGVLEQCVQSLHASSLDDIHLAARYATMLDLHIACFRDRLITSSAPRGVPVATASAGTIAADSDIDTISYQATNAPRVSAIDAEDWFSLPFDPSLAPFENTWDATEWSAFEDTSWDFLWNSTGA